MKVDADREICIGAGMCVMTAAATFDQDEEGIVVVSADDVQASEQQRARMAIGMCPSGALRLVAD